MTNAFLRKCNGCGRAFLKEDGCNKMTCPFCSNRQCYVCSKTIVDYQHFDNPQDENPCPMYGDMTEFLSAQVDSAQETAVRGLLDTRRDLKEEDIRVDTPKKRKIKTVRPQIDDDDLLFDLYIPPPRFRNIPPRQREPPPAPRPFQPAPPPLGPPPVAPHLYPPPPIEPPRMFHHPRWDFNLPPQPAALPPPPQPQWEPTPPPAMWTPPMTWEPIPPPIPHPSNPVFPMDFPPRIPHPANPGFPTTWPPPTPQMFQHGPVPGALPPWLGPEIQVYPPPNPPLINQPGPARGWW